jgi:tRNA(Arg) A34 adenosine deaminase TadA
MEHTMTSGIPTDVAIALPGWVAALVDPAHPFVSDEEKMRLAVRLAAENVERDAGGGPFGAAVFRRDTGRLVAVGVNSVIRLGNSVLHAEVVALMLAHRATGFHSFTAPGAPSLELVTSCDPCVMCLGAAHWSGISRLVCGATKSDAEALGFDEGPVAADAYDYLARRGTAVVRGVLRDEALAVLRRYQALGRPIY